MSTYRPIAATLLASTATFALFVATELRAIADEPSRPSLLLWLLGGLVYGQLFEFWAHRVAMHQGLPLLDGVRRSHLDHHREFHGERFQTRDPEALAHIAGRWWTFPLLMVAHYALVRLLAGPTAASAFLLAALAHYLVFEVTHWFSHIEDNGFDRFISRLPWIAGVRARQVDHHRRHHDIPLYAFNFNPPYLGDRLTGLLPHPPEAVPVETNPSPSPSPLPETAAVPIGGLRPWLRPALGYGSALAVGVALIGLAVVAHGRWSESRALPGVRDQLG